MDSRCQRKFGKRESGRKGEERFVLTVLMRVYMISYYSFLQFIGYTKRSSWRYKGTLAFVSTLLTVKPSYVNT